MIIMKVIVSRKYVWKTKHHCFSSVFYKLHDGKIFGQPLISVKNIFCVCRNRRAQEASGNNARGYDMKAVACM